MSKLDYRYMQNQTQNSTATTSAADVGWEDVLKQFFVILIKSPIAIFGFVLSFLLGYGISFVLFDYRNTNSNGVSRYFHLIIGLCYTAVIFVTFNFDILSREMNEDDVLKRVPFTLLMSFVIGFFLILGGVLIRQRNSQ